jgi:hypothetical protein
MHEGRLVHGEDGWVLSASENRHANVTSLPSGQIDWEQVMIAVKEWTP